MAKPTASHSTGTQLAMSVFAVVAAWLAGTALRLSAWETTDLSLPTVGSAWTASEIAEGRSAPELQHPPESALLLSTQAFAFWLLGDRDVVARLPGVVAGCLVLAALLCLPGRLRPGWVIAAILLAVSPTWVTATRAGSASQLAVLLLLCLWAIVRRGVDKYEEAGGTSVRWRSPTYEALAGSVVGCLLLVGPLFWDWLLIALVVLVSARGLGATKSAPATTESTRLTGTGIWRQSALAAALVVSTTGLTQWDGPLAVSASLTSWLESWTRATASATASPVPPKSLLIEVLLIMLLLGALALLRNPRVRPSDPSSTGQRLSGAAALCAAFLAIRPGAGADQHVTVLLTLFLLIGLAAESSSPTSAATGALRWSTATLMLVAILVMTSVYGSLAPLRSERAQRGSDLVRDVRALAGDHSGTGGAFALDVQWNDWPDPRVGWALRHTLSHTATADHSARSHTVRLTIDGDLVTLLLPESRPDQTIATYSLDADTPLSENAP